MVRKDTESENVWIFFSYKNLSAVIGRGRELLSWPGARQLHLVPATGSDLMQCSMSHPSFTVSHPDSDRILSKGLQS